MKSISLKSPAKINLGLSILGKLQNGYHEVKTIYCQISLFDLITIKKIGGRKTVIKSSDKNLPLNKYNLAYKAAEFSAKDKGLEISIQKIIPVGSGLGGGSSNAAVTLWGINKLLGLNLKLDDLIKQAKKIGMDVCYQLVGGVQLETQGGSESGKFEKLCFLPDCFIVVCFPEFRIKSKKAYKQVDYKKIGKNDLSSLKRAILAKKLKLIARNLHNDFEIWTLKRYPEINKIKKIMIKSGALGSLLSGKGSAVYGIFEDSQKAKDCFQLLLKMYPKTFLTKPLNSNFFEENKL